MPEWTKYIRQNLHLHGLRPDREAEIIEDLARQLEDAYREALAGGMAEADAAALARQHVPDWDVLNRELQRLPRGAAPALERLQESADAASRSRVWALLGGLLRDLLFAARMMQKNPGFTLVVVLTLALAIGAASAIFGVGRAFVPEEDEPGAASTVILSETMCRIRFGAAPDILEGTITLDGMNYQVVGVMPDSMRFPARVECWVSAFYGDLLGRVSALPRVGAAGISRCRWPAGEPNPVSCPRGLPSIRITPAPAVPLVPSAEAISRRWNCPAAGAHLRRTRSRRQSASDRGGRDRGTGALAGPGSFG